MRVKEQKKRIRIIIKLCILIVIFLLLFYLLQKYWAHREGYFIPDYEKVALSEESDYQTFFLQTGLGHLAVDRLLAEGGFQAILDAQETFFHPRKASCTPLIGWFTREDRLSSHADEVERGKNVEEENIIMLPRLVDLQPGDILLTLSTHSFGWRHGHAALVIDENTTLESVVWGTDATYGNTESWNSYSNYAVLRVKNVTLQLQRQVAEYGSNMLYGVPYHLSAGFLGKKAPEPGAPQFGVQCAYLVWYAWNHFGYNLDSDGGRLVSTHDLLHSELLEVAQIYGMDPREFVY